MAYLGVRSEIWAAIADCLAEDCAKSMILDVQNPLAPLGQAHRTSVYRSKKLLVQKSTTGYVPNALCALFDLAEEPVSAIDNLRFIAEYGGRIRLDGNSTPGKFRAQLLQLVPYDIPQEALVRAGRGAVVTWSARGRRYQASLGAGEKLVFEVLSRDSDCQPAGDFTDSWLRIGVGSSVPEALSQATDTPGLRMDAGYAIFPEDL